MFIYRLKFVFLLLLFISINTFAKQKPNIVFILMDDLDVAITKPFYKDVLPSTIQLEKEGLYFDNAFVTTSVCCPSRASILTGNYGHNTEVLANGGKWGGRKRFLDDECNTFPTQLNKAGYRTAIIGKYLNGFETKNMKKLPSIPYGWTEGNLFVDSRFRPYRGYRYNLMNWEKGHALSPKKWTGKTSVGKYGRKAKDYSTDVLHRKSIEFLEKAKREDDKAPFFAFIAPTCPHFPLPPAKRDIKRTKKLWGRSSLPTNRPNYFNDNGPLALGNESIPLDKPSWLRKTWKKRMRLKKYGGRAFKLTTAIFPDGPGFFKSWNEVDWMNRMGSLYACNDLIQGVHDWLKQNGEWDNTIFIVTSDNGYNIGAHALANKMAPYEESIRVPFWIASGKNVPIRRGETESEWILNIDFGPTFLQLADLKSTKPVDGKSFANLLFEKKSKEAPPLHKDFLIEYVGGSFLNGVGWEIPFIVYRAAPAYALDIPTYRAIRSRLTARVGGVLQTRTFLFTQWYTNYMPGKKRTKKAEYELYDLDRDPFQLDNLLYYKPKEYRVVREVLMKRLLELSSCKGVSCQ